MSEKANGYKLLLSYNIQPDKSQDYYQFIMGRYIPEMQAKGLEISEAWYTAYGDYPNRLVGFICRDRDTMTNLVDDESWLELNDELIEFVDDFDYKVIPYRVGFQL